MVRQKPLEMHLVLPPGVTQNDFSASLDALASIVGTENVVRDSSSGLNDYCDPWALANADRYKPSAAVRPSTVDQVQQILKIANQYAIPLWTISRGKNLGYGGPAPVVKGSVVLDLGLMKKIVEVNEEYAYAIVEPGVTFFDLYEYIQKQDLKLWISCPALGWGSVIGNCLDRGIGYTPNGDHSAQQCGMEVVLPNGEVLRTGMGAMEDSQAWALYKGGYGPSVDGLFFQSNLGVVTKLGIHLCPAPKCYISCEIHVPHEDQLGTLVGILSDLQRKRLIENFPSILNPFRTAFTKMKDAAVAAKMGPHFGKKAAIPESLLKEIITENGWGYWVAQFGLYGTNKMATAAWDEIQLAFAHVPGATCVGVTIDGKEGQPLKPDSVTDLIPHSGVPSIKEVGMWNYRGPGGHTCFAPIIPPSGRELDVWYKTVKQKIEAAGFDFFADFHVFPRYILAIALVVFAEDEGEKMHKLYLDLVNDGVKMGFSEYRTHVAYMDLIADHFGYNDSALRRYVEKLKDLTDPKGILAPGKQGVWGNSQLVKTYKAAM